MRTPILQLEVKVCRLQTEWGGEIGFKELFFYLLFKIDLNPESLQAKTLPHA
jgi:hypothetical protein